MHTFFRSHSLQKVGDAVAAGSSIDNNSARVDMTGFQNVTFFTAIVDSVATGVARLKVEQNSVDSDSGMAALAGASAQLTCAINDDINGKVLAVEVVKPSERYVQGVRTSTTANIAFGEIYAVLSHPRKKPVAAHSSIGASAVAVEPSES